LKTAIRRRIGKKGQAFDPLFISILLFATILTVIVVGMSFVKIKDAIIDNGMLNDTPQAEAMLENGASQFPTWMDNMIFFFIWGLVLLVIGSSLFLDTHPFYFIVGIFALFVSGVVWIVLKENFQSIIAGNSDLVSFALLMPKVSWFMDNFFVFFIGISLVSLVILFAKRSLNTGGGGTF
jgi:hypothetical protein